MNLTYLTYLTWNVSPPKRIAVEISLAMICVFLQFNYRGHFALHVYAKQQFIADSCVCSSLHLKVHQII